jgi:hypothetical protein
LLQSSKFFCFRETAIKGLSYIREGPKGTLTGMAVQVNEGDADISISSTEFLEYRASGPDGLSYLLPTFNLGLEIKSMKNTLNVKCNLY